MKKIYLFAALLAALSINAKEVIVDLSKFTVEIENGTATPSFADGVLTVDWSVTINDGSGIAGAELTLDPAVDKVTGLSFEDKGEGEEIGLIHYLRDVDGARWWDVDKWLSLSPTDWINKPLNKTSSKKSFGLFGA